MSSKAASPRERRRSSMYEVVQEEIKSYIVVNALQPGDPLPPETQLAQQLGISRNSVREAVKSLASLGILEVRPGTGLFVRDFSFDPLLENLAFGLLSRRNELKELNDVLAVRCHLEYAMAEQAVGVATPEQLKELDRILARMRAATDDGQYSAEADRAFHQTLWKYVDNIIFSKVLDIFWMIHNQAREHDLIPGPVNPELTYQHHVEIAAALREGDVDALHIALENHASGLQERLKIATALKHA